MVPKKLKKKIVRIVFKICTHSDMPKVLESHWYSPLTLKFRFYWLLLLIGVVAMVTVSIATFAKLSKCAVRKL